MKYINRFKEFKSEIISEKELVKMFEPPSEFDNNVEMSDLTSHSENTEDIEEVKNKILRKLKSTGKQSPNQGTLNREDELFSDD